MNSNTQNQNSENPESSTPSTLPKAPPIDNAVAEEPIKKTKLVKPRKAKTSKSLDKTKALKQTPQNTDPVLVPAVSLETTKKDNLQDTPISATPKQTTKTPTSKALPPLKLEDFLVNKPKHTAPSETSMTPNTTTIAKAKTKKASKTPKAPKAKKTSGPKSKTKNSTQSKNPNTKAKPKVQRTKIVRIPIIPTDLEASTPTPSLEGLTQPESTTQKAKIGFGTLNEQTTQLIHDEVSETDANVLAKPMVTNTIVSPEHVGLFTEATKTEMMANERSRRRSRGFYYILLGTLVLAGSLLVFQDQQKTTSIMQPLKAKAQELLPSLSPILRNVSPQKSQEPQKGTDTILDANQSELNMGASAKDNEIPPLNVSDSGVKINGVNLRFPPTDLSTDKSLFQQYQNLERKTQGKIKLIARDADTREIKFLVLTDTLDRTDPNQLSNASSNQKSDSDLIIQIQDEKSQIYQGIKVGDIVLSSNLEFSSDELKSINEDIESVKNASKSKSNETLVRKLSKLDKVSLENKENKIPKK